MSAKPSPRRRAVVLGVLGVVAFAAIGVWGVVNLLQGDWFIGSLFVASALGGGASPLSATYRRRE